jgi:hypothetical protein
MYAGLNFRRFGRAVTLQAMTYDIRNAAGA